MKVIVKDERGWFFEGFNPQGSEVECSKSVYEESKKSVKLEIKEEKKSAVPKQ